MAKTPTALDEAIARVQGSLSKQVLMTAIAGLPGTTSMGQLIDEFAGSEYNETFRGMSLNAFVDTVMGTASRKGGGGGSGGFNTRTQAGREGMDAAVSAALENAGTAGAEEIRGSVGGSAAQIRESFARLMDAGLVSRSGQKRGTRYSWKAKGKKGK